MQHQKLTAVALITRNSLSYIESVFSLNEARQLIVNVPDESFAHALTGLDIERCITPEEGGGWFVASHPLIRADLPAQVTYTSGTEGKPKGIVLTYANLADASERIINQMELTSDVREYVGVPVNYSFGFARIRAVSAVGGQAYLPPRGFDPLELSRMLKSGEVNALSAVPTLLRILLQAKAVIGDAGKKLRWMEIGSQYMSAAEKREIRELFPNARIVQHYGLTEASRSTFLRISEVPDELLESVGTAVGATEVAISEEGRIRIRGPHVARWRLDSEALLDLCGPDGWLETNDLGHIKDGQLYYDGRADDLINVGGIKINPDTLEARIGQNLRQGGKIIVTKVPDALRGEGILVAAETPDITTDQLHFASAEALKELGIVAGDALHVRIVSALPRTATGKPLRRLLADEFVEAGKVAAAAPVSAQAVEAEPCDVLGFFRQFFPGRRIGPNDSFETMGGDSLSYIQFSLGLEERFGALPDGWESMTIEQLEKRAGTSERGGWRKLDASTLTRAFFMLCIVAEHLDTFIYSKNWGAAYFLFMLGGYSIIRFQWPEISRTGKVDTIFGTVLNVAIPTILVVAFMQSWARTFELKPLLLISNWFDPSQYHIAYYYFAEIYIQLILVVAVMLSFSKIRTAITNSPMVFCTAFVVIATIASWMVERVWDTNYLYHRTPIWYLWTVAAGMLMGCARDRQNRVVAMVIVSTAVLIHHGYTSASAYIIGGAALLLFGTAIKVPSVVKSIVSEIAGSSMFIYLSHAQVRSIVIRLFHGPRPWIAFYVAIGFGIVFAHSYHWVDRKVRVFLSTYRGRVNAGGIPKDALLRG
ncbi:acyl-CoA synthetase (AMP-forming)/AMP-acid ligase II [Novosphingobium sp. PhB165]|uniref:AMP-binding protein n=1 Tax=Novosphingobium sp. PhB165 TaxID=2485105 RepID=UPI0010450C23|nr:AMP-binding protein [Novosphingobium sp. PhB165]TCM16430.1 acyl-CoA synthetase (AMP-forming)/AMP-acid ligase II [Novosphingobium sp. PhB165]